MRLFVAGFVIGVVTLEQSAALPNQAMMAAFASCVVALTCWLAASTKRLRGQRAQRDGKCAALPGDVTLPRTYVVCACAVITFAGIDAGYLWAAWSAQRALSIVLPDAYAGRDIDIAGHVVGLPVDTGQGVRFVFEIEQGVPPDRAFPRRILLTAYRSASPQAEAMRDEAPDLRPMQRWRMTVRLRKPHRLANFHASNGEAALLEQGIRATGTVRPRQVPTLVSDEAASWVTTIRYASLHPGAAINRLRDGLRRRIVASLGDGTHAGIVVALAIGDQSGIRLADQQRFARTGTRHLIAVSGLHVSLAAGTAAAIISLIWRRLPGLARRAPLCVASPRIAGVAGTLAAFAYAAVAGFGVPALRAFVMSATAAGAMVFGRRPGASTVFAWASGIVLIVDPWAVLGAGFWLSFGAVGAILFAQSARTMPSARRTPSEQTSTVHTSTVQPSMQRGGIAKRSRMARAWPWVRARVGEATRTQWAVTVALVPASICWFYSVPLVGPLANAIAIPWASLLITPMTLAGALLPAPLDAWIWQGAHANLAALMKVMDGLAQLSFAVLWLRAPNPMVLGLAIAGAVVMLMPSGWPLRAAAWLLWLPLAWPGDDRLPQGTFRVTVFDVGQGTAALVQTRAHTLVFDTGPRYGDQGDAGRSIVVPALSSLGARRIDRLIVSHADIDHAGGAASLVEDLNVRSLRASLRPDDPLWRAVPDAVRCAAGEHWQWDGVRFDMVWPDRVAAARDAASRPGTGNGDYRNASSCVVRVSNGVVAALLPGDIEAAQERELVARDTPLQADLLVVPHHGSRTSSTESFLDSVAPRDAVFPVGYANRFGHPAAAVVQRYAARGVRQHRTDLDGAVRATSVGAGFLVERCRTVRRRYWMDEPAHP
ncbi:MAG TPA: DNA internalization-related competence protein ComEC/Rec2 [Pararobbsia sp.]|nr:DNA internalization-related competence protein ComEC/Rec2 [Pararobbsia sp.]